MRRAKLPLSPCAFHLCQYIKGVVFFWSNKDFFSPLHLLSSSLSSIYAFSTPLFPLCHHMSKGRIVAFLPEALKASSAEQICRGPRSRWMDVEQGYLAPFGRHWDDPHLPRPYCGYILNGFERKKYFLCFIKTSLGLHTIGIASSICTFNHIDIYMSLHH